MSDEKPFKHWLNEVAAGRILTESEASKACEAIVSGAATSAQIGGFLTAIRLRGETVDEIVGFARVLRSHMMTIKAPANAVDTCGTGGDGSGSFNVSTAAAFVIAGCGLPVAKHGNRALSSRSGSADVLLALGINIDAPLVVMEHAIDQAQIAFLMAPRHHPAMNCVAEVRRELAIRTIFNLLGPLTNPAGVQRQVVGVFSPAWVGPLAEVLQCLGSDACWVVHGCGLDEITTTGPTSIAALQNGRIRKFDITPEELGLRRVDQQSLAGGSPEENAATLRALLDGQDGPLRDIVCLNAAAALVVGKIAPTLEDGLLLAQKSIDDGAARYRLEQLVTITNGRA